MYHNESIRTARLSDYSLYAPAEFFAETYTVYYEEAGRQASPRLTMAG